MPQWLCVFVELQKQKTFTFTEPCEVRHIPPLMKPTSLLTCWNETEHRHSDGWLQIEKKGEKTKQNKRKVSALERKGTVISLKNISLILFCIFFWLQPDASRICLISCNTLHRARLCCEGGIAGVTAQTAALEEFSDHVELSCYLEWYKISI